MDAIRQELLDILVCPKCRQAVRQEADALACSNNDCSLRYPIRDGVPVMLIDEAAAPPPGDELDSE